MQAEQVVEIDGSKITDFASFHREFQKAMGFPAFYGKNMNAWIDCMRDIHEDTHMSNILLPKDVPLTLKIQSTEAIEKHDTEILSTLSSCTAFVNQYHAQHGWAPILLLYT